MRINATFYFAYLLLLCFGAFAEERQTNLEKVTEKIEQVDVQFRELVSKLETTQGEKSAQEQDLKQARGREASAKKQLSLVQGELDTLRQQLAESEKKIGRLKLLWKQRIRAIYMYREASVFGGLISVSAQGLDRKALYIARLREFDHKLADEMEKQMVLQQARRNELQQKINQEQKLVAGLALERGKIEKSVAALSKLSADLVAQKAALSKSLVELKAQALRLETVVTSLTGGEEEAGSKLPAIKKEQSASTTTFDGQGLFRLKGALALPIKGEVVRGFGKKSVKRLDDIVASKGVEYRASEGTQVQAIAPGRVIHVGRMPGYGNIVIVDHGKRYYSLYGKLDKIEVKKGQDLERGTEVGILGLPEGADSNFYFEIRRNGEAVNPLDYYKRL